MTKYLSFSLWGSKPIYCIGAIKNAELISKMYNGWKMVVFYDSTVPQPIIKRLNEMGVITIDATTFETYGMFWRFFAYTIDDCEYVVFRDADSRISEREFSAVDEWINSGKTIHVMRDHPAHRIPYGTNRPGILGGMWGIKKTDYNLFEHIVSFIENKELNYGSDQTFLSEVYETFQDDMMVHDEFSDGLKFPLPRVNKRFIGERIDANESPLTNDHLQIP
jgi:hypothetical protein